MTALSLAAYRGSAGAVEKLLQCRARLSAAKPGQWTPLMWAAFKGHVSMVETLLKAKSDVHATCDPEKGIPFLKMVKQLVDPIMLEREIIKVGSVATKRWTAVMMAKKMGHHNVLQVMLKHMQAS